VIWIGIDPPAGLAIWDSRQKKFTVICTSNFWGIIATLEVMKLKIFEDGTDCRVVLEAPQKNLPVWRSNGRPDPEKLRQWSKLCQNVGMNKQSAMLIEEYCKQNVISYQLSRPQKGSMSKLSAERFKQITGWNKATSQHGRDAAMLVFGR
jgi:hypothetical protein